jgi:short-subunit dehydrogenase
MVVDTSRTYHIGLRDQLRWYYKAPKVHVTIVHPLWVSTPLVAHAKAEIEASSGTMLTPQEVAKTITNQVWKCRGGRLIIPGKMGWFYTTRAWPVWMLDLVKGSGKGQSSLLEKVTAKEGER